MRAPTRVILSGVAAAAVVGGMSAAAYALSDGTELFKSPETIALEEQNKADAEALLTDQESAIEALSSQIAEAEAALAQAQAEYDAALAAANASAPTSGSVNVADTTQTQTVPGATGAVQAPAPAPQPQDEDHEDHEEHENHEEGADDDD